MSKNSFQKPFLIGISGGSGSGKTTIVEKLLEEFKNDSIICISHDDYYRDFPELSFEEKTAVNFDHPASLETELLVEHLHCLMEGESIHRPNYDFVTYARSKKTKLVKPSLIIVVEGILLLEDPYLRKLLDLKIFVDTDADIRLARKIERDMTKRGRTLEYILQQYENFTRPMHLQFVEPNKRFADIIIPEGGHNLPALHMMFSHIRSILK